MASRFSSRLLRHLHGRRQMFAANSRLLVPPIADSPSTISHTSPFSLRFLSTRPLRPTRAKKPDIGARARQLQSRRLWTYALTFSGVAGFIIIVLYQFQDQLVFYVTPTEALDKYNSNPSKSRFRLGGLVLENSVAEIPYSQEIHFVITDLLTDILVKYEGSLPDLFREGHSVVVEGFVRPVVEEIKKKEEANLNSNKLGVMAKARNLDCYFMATDVLAKHDEKYMPAEVAAAIEKNKKLIEEEQNKKEEETG
ncbi:cytochrome c-type biogenesis protein CcmE homolog, mitochondrial [Andrographis paniculata]|uniref:cytochrome c-type biogenesis protein CcmE homolog, mitochondrial n=1 Tax=Andrographis paniculata TaxID=175694 RepID=UPI0021E6EAA0|nr:cytochrome c-type biogenesis protein CcmE homolog, mitochondrial [Andrographis paniculata]